MASYTQLIGRIVPIHRGSWSNTTLYRSLDEVYYQGSTYRVRYNINPPVGSLPTNTQYWVRTAQAGASLTGAEVINNVAGALTIEFTLSDGYKFQMNTGDLSGDNGVGIQNIALGTVTDENYQLVFTLSNFETNTILVPRLPGPIGPYVLDIESTDNEDYTIDITFTMSEGDPIVITTPNLRGEAGPPVEEKSLDPSLWEDVSQGTILGRTSTGSGSLEYLTYSSVRSALDVDKTSTALAPAIDIAELKPSIHDDDKFGIVDSENSNILRGSLWSTIKSVLRSYFDPVYAPISHTHTLEHITDKGDSAARNVGTEAGTVAAGDDPRIVNAIQKSGGVIDNLTINHSINGILSLGGAISAEPNPLSSGDVWILGNLLYVRCGETTRILGSTGNLQLVSEAEVTTGTSGTIRSWSPARVGQFLSQHGLKPNESKNLTAGYTATAANDGTRTSGTYTPSPLNGNLRRVINGGAHTLAAPSAAGDYTIIIQYTNNSNAGNVTLSGFNKVTGDSFTTTNNHRFMVYITKINNIRHVNVVAMQ